MYIQFNLPGKIRNPVRPASIMAKVKTKFLRAIRIPWEECSRFEVSASLICAVHETVEFL